MSAAPTHGLDADPAAEIAALRVRQLGVLAEIGLGMAKRVAREIEAAEVGGLDTSVPSLAYDRIARAVRLSLMLQERLQAAEAARVKQAAAERAARPVWEKMAEERAEARRKAAPPSRRDKAVQAVEAMIERQAGDTQAEYDAMARTFRERLEDYGERDFARRPLSAIIAEICNALGVEPDWTLWADEAWAVEEAEQGRTGSPYAGTAQSTTAAAALARPALAAGAAVTILERLPP